MLGSSSVTSAIVHSESQSSNEYPRHSGLITPAIVCTSYLLKCSSQRTAQPATQLNWNIPQAIIHFRADKYSITRCQKIVYALLICKFSPTPFNPPTRLRSKTIVPCSLAEVRRFLLWLENKRRTLLFRARSLHCARCISRIRRWSHHLYVGRRWAAHLLRRGFADVDKHATG